MRGCNAGYQATLLAKAKTPAQDADAIDTYYRLAARIKSARVWTQDQPPTVLNSPVMAMTRLIAMNAELHAD